MVRSSLFLSGLFLFSTSSHAITYDQWTSKNVLIREVYLSGMGEGMSWLNSDAHPKVYCAPEMLGLSGQNYIDILENYVSRNSDPAVRRQELGLLLLFALQEVFPCGR